MKKVTRTTLDLDEDILLAVTKLAEQRRQTVGRVISDLVRAALEPKTASRMRNGVPPFRPKRGAKIPSLALINKLRDNE
ncbi:MAG TPA: hypothetical protein VH157_14025 [Bryobacteraceae bacterium]|jgi:hypothetical protein|nr:hypothetical protein [Bryobacteraceae bacterium]